MAIGFALSPLQLLLHFVFVNMLNYVDRGVIAGVLPALQAEFGLDSTQTGFLGSSFVISYMVFSLPFAQLSQRFSPFVLMGVGLVCWIGSALVAYFSTSFQLLLIARIMSGLGEASFQCLAPPFIDDYAPDHLRGAWLAIFYSAIPIGQAAGFVFGGKMNSSSLGWRGAFLLESFAMAPFALVCFFATNRFKPRKNAVDSSSASQNDNMTMPLLGEQPVESSSSLSPVAVPPSLPPLSPLLIVKRVFADVWRCLRTPMWTLATFGYASFTFTLGSFAYWGPTIVTKLFPDVPLDTADLAFGGVTAGTGLVGTAIGGLILDRLIKREACDQADGSLSKSGKTMLILFVSMCIGSPVLFFAFFMKSFPSMISMLAVGELFLFITTAPSNAVLLWCVPSDQRAFSMAFSVVVMHLFGDVPSPVFTGYLLQRYGTTPAVLTVTAFLSFAILCWGAGFVYEFPPPVDQLIYPLFAMSPRSQDLTICRYARVSRHRDCVG